MLWVLEVGFDLPSFRGGAPPTRDRWIVGCRGTDHASHHLIAEALLQQPRQLSRDSLTHCHNHRLTALLRRASLIMSSQVVSDSLESLPGPNNAFKASPRTHELRRRLVLFPGQRRLHVGQCRL